MALTVAGRRRQRSRRERATGRFAPGEHFAMIPVDVMLSEAWAALPDYAVRVALALAAQYRGTNNGNLSLTQVLARELGIRALWKIPVGLQLLMRTGLILRTREGKVGHGRGICALYALGWKPINMTPNAYPSIDRQLPAPNDWLRWKRSPDWYEFEKRVRRRARGRRNNSDSTFDQTPREVQIQSLRGD